MARKIQTTLGLTETAKTKLDLLAAKRGLSNNELIEQLILREPEQKTEIPLLLDSDGNVMTKMLIEVNDEESTFSNVTLIDDLGNVWGGFNGVVWSDIRLPNLTQILIELSELYENRKAYSRIVKKVKKFTESMKRLDELQRGQKDG